MADFCTLARNLAKNQSLRLLKDRAGQMAQPMAFSLTGLGMAALASLLLLDAGLDMQSQHFLDKILKALSIF